MLDGSWNRERLAQGGQRQNSFGHGPRTFSVKQARTWPRGGWSLMWRSIGSTKASVLPLPVLATPMQSRPLMMIGSACACNPRKARCRAGMNCRAEPRIRFRLSVHAVLVHDREPRRRLWNAGTCQLVHANRGTCQLVHANRIRQGQLGRTYQGQFKTVSNHKDMSKLAPGWAWAPSCRPCAARPPRGCSGRTGSSCAPAAARSCPAPAHTHPFLARWRIRRVFACWSQAQHTITLRGMHAAHTASKWEWVAGAQPGERT